VKKQVLYESREAKDYGMAQFLTKKQPDLEERKL